MHTTHSWIFFLGVTLSFASFGQGNLSDSKLSYTFPDDWLGTWEGTLEIYSNSTLKQSVQMALYNEPTDTVDVYRWAIRYGDNPDEGLRDYKLRVVDKTRGHYVVDEMNSIYLDSYLVLNKLIAPFEVQGNMLQSVYERSCDHLIFEITVSDTKPARLSGNTEFDKESIPEVKSYNVKTYQRAVLNKTK